MAAKSMNAYSDNEGWVVERGGSIVEKQVQRGPASLNTWERLVYCLWVADYMMRNAGDFANAEVMYPDFQTDAKQLARQLSLPATCATFSLSRRKLQRKYFERFEAMCNEIRNAEPAGAPKGSLAATVENSGSGRSHAFLTQLQSQQSVLVCTHCGAWKESSGATALLLVLEGAKPDSPQVKQVSDGSFFAKHLKECGSQGGWVRRIRPDHPEWSTLDPKKREE